MRAGSRFGMILDGKYRQCLVAEAGDGLVIEVYMCHFNACGQTLCIDRKTMIMRCYLDLSGRQIHDRLVAAAMAEF